MLKLNIIGAEQDLSFIMRVIYKSFPGSECFKKLYRIFKKDQWFIAKLCIIKMIFYILCALIRSKLKKNRTFDRFPAMISNLHHSVARDRIKDVKKKKK